MNTHDIGKVIDNQQEILEQYWLDIAQYAEGNDMIKNRAIFDSTPTQLSEKKCRFYVNSLNKNARLNIYDNSFKWLDDTDIALPCYSANAPQAQLALNEKHNLFWLYMNDVGLLCAVCMDNIQLDILKGNFSINMASVLENVMAQQLKAQGFSLYYYNSTRIGELNFFVQKWTRIVALEIKLGSDHKKHTALNNALAVGDRKFAHAYVLCKGNVEGEGAMTYLPWYFALFLHLAEIPKSVTYEVDISDLDDAVPNDTD